MKSRNVLVTAAALVAALSLPLFGDADASAAPEAPPVSVAGKVVAATGEPAPDARVTIMELKRRTTTSADGTFRFDGIPPGSYLVEAVSPKYGRAVQRVAAGATPEPVTLTLDVGLHEEQVTVTANLEVRTLGEIAQPVNILNKDDIDQRIQPTIGETLAGEPGVASTFFGRGASRPVIRGMGGDRIRLLQDGVGVGDVSATSPDHAVTVNTLTTDKIEIVRGPATLLYGSSAIGGVVNSSDTRIASYLLEGVLSGAVDLGLASVADEARGALSLDGRLGNFVLHGDASKLTSSNYDIPGFARIPVEPGDPEGFVPNSAVETEGAAGAISYVGNAGYLGVSYSGFNSVYGSPAEEEVEIDLAQRRVDVAGQLTTPFAFLRGAKVRFGTNDYQHDEIEGGEKGTTFTDTGWEGRLELPHKPLGPLTGAFGVQIIHRDLEAVGEERFIPPTDTDSQGVFLFEEAPLGTAVRAQGGFRWEHSNVDAPESPDIQSRSFNGYSGSLGLVWTLAPGWVLAASGARTTKLPNAQELFADGPHIGTNAFEIGDPNLQDEISTGVDVVFRRTEGIVSGSVAFFYQTFDGFIFERFTDEIIDDLQVIRYTQADARFIGGEGHLDIELLHAEPHHLILEVAADYVNAELTPSDEPLPRIPPLRYGGGLRYKSATWQGLFEVRRTDEQDQVAPFETVTPGYTFVNAMIGYRFFFGPVIADVLVTGTNLTDQEARNNVSFLKDVAPLPGRNVSLGLRAAF
jgi:iron complex outermembrane recepter protein